MQRRHFLALAGAFPLRGRSAPTLGLRTITYAPDDGLFPNPERGFYYGANCEGRDEYNKGIMFPPHPPLRVDELKAMREGPDCITLVRDCIRIGHFWTTDISAARLAEIERDWAAVREAGLKVLPRFVYSYGIDNADPPEETVMRHLDQIGPLLRRNLDVIAWLQTGLFGGCGCCPGLPCCWPFCVMSCPS